MPDSRPRCRKQHAGPFPDGRRESKKLRCAVLAVFRRTCPEIQWNRTNCAYRSRRMQVLLRSSRKKMPSCGSFGYLITCIVDEASDCGGRCDEDGRFLGGT